MEASKSPAPNSNNGKRELTYTDKRTLVMARSALAIMVDALTQARKAGMKFSTTNMEHDGHQVVVMAMSLPGHDVMADGLFLLDGRDVTDPADWEDLRDVMAEAE